MENRVITKQVCLKFNAFDPVVWGHDPITKLYGADISYTASHGDRTCGIPFGFGLDAEGVLRLAPLELPLIYSPSDRSSGSIEEQIAMQMRAECARLNIPPEHVFFDGSGRSSFTAAVMRLWSASVNAVDFLGRATNRPNFINKRYQEDDGGRKKKGDLLPCDEVFGKFVSELWFATRYWIEADQARSLSGEVAKEGYARLWVFKSGNLMDVEPKDEMKLRLGRSPDLWDTVAVAVEGARRLGFKLGKLDNSGKPGGKKSIWLPQLRKDFLAAQKAVELTV